MNPNVTTVNPKPCSGLLAFASLIPTKECRSLLVQRLAADFNPRLPLCRLRLIEAARMCFADSVKGRYSAYLWTADLKPEQ